MDFGTIKFSKPGSDETVCEVPWVPTTATLVRARLAEAGNDSFGSDDNAVGTYAAFYNAELMGHKLVELPRVEDIKPSDVFAAAFQYGFTLELPDGAAEEAEEAEGNPTATTGASS